MRLKEDPAEAVVISKKDMKALDRESRKKLKGRFAEGSTLFCLQERSQERGHGSCVQVYHAGGGPRREAGGRALLHPGGGVLGTATSCPLAFESAGSGVVTFRARGQEFRIVLLAESRPLTETNSQDAVLVRMGPLSKGLKATFHHGYKTTPPRLVASDMLWGCDLNAYTHFKIVYTAGRGVQLINYANGQSTFYSDSLCGRPQACVCLLLEEGCFFQGPLPEVSHPTLIHIHLFIHLTAIAGTSTMLPRHTHTHTKYQTSGLTRHNLTTKT